MKTKPYRIVLVLLLLALLPVSAAAQDSEETLELRLTRDWGYGGFGDDIQGTFSLRASGPDDLARVDFLIDGQVVHTIDEAPFRYQFNTDDYALGMHTLTAIGYTAQGDELTGREFTREFVSASASGDFVMKTVLPLVAVILVIAVVVSILPGLLGRNKGRFELGKYGAAGGAVCPRCQMPYARSFLAPNMLVGKLSHCPHCGKWAIVRAASAANLQAAEDRYRAENESGIADSAESEEDKLRRMIDDSRFDE